jgi:transcription elongation factor Elf1
MSEEIEEQLYKERITCPFCKHVHRDSWEHQQDDGTMECHECDKEFVYSRHTSITYTTSAPKQK